VDLPGLIADATTDAYGVVLALLNVIQTVALAYLAAYFHTGGRAAGGDRARDSDGPSSS
jgi:hypothetical protein